MVQQLKSIKRIEFRQPYIRDSDLKVLLQAVLLGLLTGEAWHMGQVIGLDMLGQLLSREITLITPILTISGLAACAFYLYVRGALKPITGILRSRRIDVVSLTAIGLTASLWAGGLGTDFYRGIAEKLSFTQQLVLVSLPLTVILAYVLKAFFPRRGPRTALPIFISDTAIQNDEEDLLDVNKKAKQFSERVLNGGSTESLVFGLDAPWGAGKSSFINLCCKHWRNAPDERVIIHRFEPLRYEDNSELTGRFVEDLVNTIQKHAYAPSIRPLFSKYSELVKGTSDFSLFGLRLEPSQATVEDTLRNLASSLEELNVRVIIVVDDLDRLAWVAIKNILFAVKRSFMLPNISYVLCYDTEQIFSSESQFDDADHVREFLEKFVNVKFSLFVSSKSLAAYAKANFQAALGKNLQIDHRIRDELRAIVSEVASICESNEFHQYQFFLGDIRKLKRFINTLIVCAIEGTDFENSDYDKNDLLHLLLLYLNFPEVFRKIYTTETYGKSGYFSLTRDYTGSPIRWKNSQAYEIYFRELESKNKKFLLKKLFDVNDRLSSSATADIGEQKRRSLACFNDPPYRNLERYLNLIVHQQRQELRESYAYYVNIKNDLIRHKQISSIFEDEKLAFSRGDFARTELWRVIGNSAGEFDSETGEIVVTHLLNTLPQYSTLEAQDIGVGSRRRLIYSLLTVLDETPWGSVSLNRRVNQQTKASIIAEWIFGEGQRDNRGIIDSLTSEGRGALGWADVMLFRLYCSADRGGSMFNLHNALALHTNPPGPTHGLTTQIAVHGMRELSQHIFRKFFDRYITPGKNFLEEVDELSFEELTGQYSCFVADRMAASETLSRQVTTSLDSEKTRIKSFVVYQLGNSFINNGVGCGFYDEHGSHDQKGIASTFNAYLFDVCFNPWMNDRAFDLFLDYLLTQFSHRFSHSGEGEFVADINEFTKVLERDRLAMYWLDYGPAIRALRFHEREKTVFTLNYSPTYSEGIPQVYAALDELALAYPQYRGNPPGQ